MKWYDDDMKHEGFTLVELLIVIVVIGILASISVVSYRAIRDNAMDAKIRSAVATAGDAIALAEARNNGVRTISVTGFFNTAGSVDTLVSTGYLKTDYREGLTSKNAATSDTILKWYPCSDGEGGFAVFASLNRPSTEDIANFNKLRTACFATDTIRNANVPITGTNVYNYAQLF
jgi:prepilin-type N-terminal cleavage/methylation domain-containing protein